MDLIIGQHQTHLPGDKPTWILKAETTSSGRSHPSYYDATLQREVPLFPAGSEYLLDHASQAYFQCNGQKYQAKITPYGDVNGVSIFRVARDQPMEPEEEAETIEILPPEDSVLSPVEPIETPVEESPEAPNESPAEADIPSPAQESPAPVLEPLEQSKIYTAGKGEETDESKWRYHGSLQDQENGLELAGNDHHFIIVRNGPVTDIIPVCRNSHIPESVKRRAFAATMSLQGENFVLSVQFTMSSLNALQDYDMRRAKRKTILAIGQR